MEPLGFDPSNVTINLDQVPNVFQNLCHRVKLGTKIVFVLRRQEEKDSATFSFYLGKNQEKLNSLQTSQKPPNQEIIYFLEKEKEPVESKMCNLKKVTTRCNEPFPWIGHAVYPENVSFPQIEQNLFSLFSDRVQEIFRQSKNPIKKIEAKIIQFKI